MQAYMRTRVRIQLDIHRDLRIVLENMHTLHYRVKCKTRIKNKTQLFILTVSLLVVDRRKNAFAIGKTQAHH